MYGLFKVSSEHDTKQIKKKNRISLLLVTYNPAFKNLSTVLGKIVIFFNSNTEVRTVFTPCPFVAYWIAQNLKTFFMRSRVCLLERPAGLSKYGSKRCQVCMFQKKIYLNPFRKRDNIRLIIASVSININEVIIPVLNFFFFYDKISQVQKSIKTFSFLSMSP